MEPVRPVGGTYWVDPGRLLAGGYPSAQDLVPPAERFERFRDAGIRLFVDLTEPGELPPYAGLLGGARHRRCPIPDFGTVTTETYRDTLDLVDEALGADVGVYIHCFGGLGRTGTVVGCWLVRHGLDDGDALRRIAELRRALPDAALLSPQTEEQRLIVQSWRRGG